ncbi:hypothetical protein FB567DRAFT_448444 [Paraphoma chrysanthemicola]|uniref:Uncharacterized protein n=1 Tax=Paraphoma chrysanthemicola TaxID=798071 RepID=A0A8K0R0B7_9PLEO|nr:hypothetical protein FB567DRAFT_448444 [Paraphoma chrysanthemicola]
MSCAIGNTFIAITGGLLDRSKRRRSLYVSRPIVFTSSRVAKDLQSLLRQRDRR